MERSMLAVPSDLPEQMPDQAATKLERMVATRRFKHSLKRAVYNLLPWTLQNADQGTEGLMEKLEGGFI